MEIARSAVETVSPVERSTSTSRSSGRGAIFCESAMSRFVSPAIADTITTTSCPCARVATTRRATFRMRSTSPTLVPPYFWTISAIALPRRLELRQRAPGRVRHPHDRVLQRRAERRHGGLHPEVAEASRRLRAHGRLRLRERADEDVAARGIAVAAEPVGR